MKYPTFARLSLFSFFLIAVLTASSKQHKELGKVTWLRNYEEAVEQAKEKGKPILLLFQEVPGCAGCINYGETTLSDPLIVDAIEGSFIPVAIFNNKSGYDAKILKEFGEPAWNFQVMRFINMNGVDIIPRMDKIWSRNETAARMVEALEAYKYPVPEYLRSLAWSAPHANLKTAAFSMSCFWDGEARIGSIGGVVETEAGWLNGEEVVKLKYDPKLIEWVDLVKQARASRCANRIYSADTINLGLNDKGTGVEVRRFVPAEYRAARSSDQKRHLQFSKLREVALNPIQRTKINAALSMKDSAMISKWLSPTQARLNSKILK